MSIMVEPKYVLFTFPDNTHFVMLTTLNTRLVPKLESGCLYNMEKEYNIPVSYFTTATRKILDEYPEEYRKETEYYEKLLLGINEVPTAGG